MFIKRISVAINERAIVYKGETVKAILNPGTHHYIDVTGQTKVTKHDISKQVFDVVNAELIVNHIDNSDRFFDIISTLKTEVAVIYKDDIVFDVIPPACKKIFWRTDDTRRVERYDLTETIELSTSMLANFRTMTNSAVQRLSRTFLYMKRVPTSFIGLLKIDGKIVKQLEPGFYGFWHVLHDVDVELIDMRVQALDVSGQEILTKDKVSLRINLSINFQVVDAIKMVSVYSDYKDNIYRELQFGLREAVGTRTLDELLQDKQAMNNLISSKVNDLLMASGIHKISIGVKDIILPGEMREIFNQVVQAEKAAQANIIRRREETAATRSLNNTAKMMENNPVLLRLKELESLEKITGKIDSINIYSGLDGMMNGLVKIPNSDQNKAN